jgi:succinate dehydrogenase / fumarate reductase iron-sulfur subunit
VAEYTLKVRRFQPETGEGPYWEEFNVDLDPSLSVLDGLLQAKDRDDGSLSVRCSCRAAICGSCGMKVNGSSTLACKTQIGEAHAAANRRGNGAASSPPRGADEDYTPTTRGSGGTPGRGSEGQSISVSSGPSESEDVPLDQRERARAEEAAPDSEDVPQPIVVEPMGNMPVIKDLITDMESTHWEKIRRVTPWLLPHGEPPEREYVVEPSSMIDITQSMACIQCGACVSSCLSMEADPDFIGPAALAKAYRFVGDPRDAETKERLHDLAHDPHGIYDCTHCFSCIDACPKGVAPMDQIMRLRRRAAEQGIDDDPNHGHSHMAAFTGIIEKKGTLDEALLLQESYAPGLKGKLKPSMGAIKGLLGSIPTGLRAFRTGKARSLKKMIPGVHPKLPDGAQDDVQAIYRHAEEHREEFNLYIKGEEGDEEAAISEGLEPERAGGGGAAQSHAGGGDEALGAGEETTEERPG